LTYPANPEPSHSSDHLLPCPNKFSVLQTMSKIAIVLVGTSAHHLLCGNPFPEDPSDPLDLIQPTLVFLFGDLRCHHMDCGVPELVGGIIAFIQLGILQRIRPPVPH